MIQRLLDCVATSVRAGSQPGSGKNEWTFIALAVTAAIFAVVIVFATATS